MSVTKVSKEQLPKVIVHDVDRGEYRIRGTGPDIRFPDEALRGAGNGVALIDAIATLVCIRARAERKRRRARRKARRGWA